MHPIDFIERILEPVPIHVYGSELGEPIYADPDARFCAALYRGSDLLGRAQQVVTLARGTSRHCFGTHAIAELVAIEEPYIIAPDDDPLNRLGFLLERFAAELDRHIAWTLADANVAWLARSRPFAVALGEYLHVAADADGDDRVRVVVRVSAGAAFV